MKDLKGSSSLGGLPTETTPTSQGDNPSLCSKVFP